MAVNPFLQATLLFVSVVLEYTLATMLVVVETIRSLPKWTAKLVIQPTDG